MSSFLQISARQVRYSGRRPPVPGDIPPSRPRRTSFKPCRLSTHWPLITDGVRGAPLSGYLSAICCRTAASSMSPMPKLLMVLTALEMRPRDKRDRAFRLFRSFARTSDHLSLSSLLVACLLLSPSPLLIISMSLSNNVRRPPQSSMTRQFILWPTKPLPALPPLFPCRNRAWGRIRSHLRARSRARPPSASKITWSTFVIAEAQMFL